MPRLRDRGATRLVMDILSVAYVYLVESAKQFPEFISKAGVGSLAPRFPEKMGCLYRLGGMAVRCKQEKTETLAAGS